MEKSKIKENRFKGIFNILLILVFAVSLTFASGCCRHHKKGCCDGMKDHKKCGEQQMTKCAGKCCCEDCDAKKCKEGCKCMNPNCVTSGAAAK